VLEGVTDGKEDLARVLLDGWRAGKDYLSRTKEQRGEKKSCD